MRAERGKGVGVWTVIESDYRRRTPNQAPLRSGTQAARNRPNAIEQPQDAVTPASETIGFHMAPPA